jgi:hypothetical protein
MPIFCILLWFLHECIEIKDSVTHNKSFCEHDNEYSGSVNTRSFLGQLHDYQLLKKKASVS